MDTPIELVKNFWCWFGSHHADITEAIARGDDSWLRENLTPQVRGLQTGRVYARLNWEIGPGREKEWRFTISPVVRENIELTKFAVMNAPEFSNWELHYFKPPKTDEPFLIQLADASGAAHEVDAQAWSYLTKRSSDGVGVLLIGEGVRGLSQTMRKRIAYLLLDNILGEQRVLDLVGEALVLEKSDVPSHVSIRPITSLRDEIAHD